VRKKFILFYLAGAFVAPLTAHASSLELCKSAVDKMSKFLPVRKDSNTVVKNVGCAPGQPKIRFVYRLEISGLSQDILSQIDVNKDIKPDALNLFCTDPNMRALLNEFDVDHRYYSERGVFVGSFLMESRECGRR